MTLAELNLDGMTLPQEVPVTLPSELVRQRPDIRAAEAQLHQATAQVGVATANLYPQITLSGSYGSQALHTGDLFAGGTKVWSLGAGSAAAAVPRRHAARGEARGRSRPRQGRGRLPDDRARRVPERRRQPARARARRRKPARAVRRGAVGEAEPRSRQHPVQGRRGELPAVLDATRQYQQARIGLIQARAARLSDTAALYAALGGGWNEGKAPALAQATPAAAPQLEAHRSNDSGFALRRPRMQTRVEGTNASRAPTKRMIIMIVAGAAADRRIVGIKVVMVMKMIAGMKPPPPSVVSTAKAKFEDWQPQLTAVGTLRAVRGVDLALEIAGLVTKVNLKSGEEVKEGQVLLQLRDSEDVAQLHQLEAAAELAERHVRARQAAARRAGDQQGRLRHRRRRPQGQAGRGRAAAGQRREEAAPRAVRGPRGHHHGQPRPVPQPGHDDRDAAAARSDLRRFLPAAAASSPSCRSARRSR